MFAPTFRSAAVALGAVALLGAGIAAPASAESSISDKPGKPMTLDLRTINGTGCPSGTTAVAMSPDNQAMTVTYSDFTATTGPNVALKEARKACQMAVALNVPQGFSLAVYKSDYRGYGKIDKGATGNVKASYYFQGQSEQGEVDSPLNGGHDGDYLFTDTIDNTNLVWSRCGETQIMNAKLALRINKGSSKGESVLNADSTDSSVSTLYSFQWKKC